jgi:regulator of RNase E activity RraA
MPNLKPETREKLKRVSTATICTALYKRGLRNQFIQDVRPLNPNGAPMVGEAFTLRYIPAREDLNPLSVFQDRAHPQRKAVEDCPPGAVFVIDSRKDPARGLGRLHPGDPPDEARRGGGRDRRRLSRLP